MTANGYLPLSSLTQVDGWAFLETDTAHAWVAFCNEMVSRGFDRPTISAPDGAYRDFAGQVYWKNYWTAQGKPGNASTPGFSNHGWGTCVDVWNVYQYPFATVLEVMRDHGFVHDYAPELWHFHRTSTNPADLGSTIIPVTVTPPPPPPYLAPQEDDMFRLYYRQDAPTAASPSGTTYALGALDPSWQTPGHNFWFEATSESRRDWRELFGYLGVDGLRRPYPVDVDIWNARSNDPNRISDVSKYVPLVAGGGTVTTVAAAPLSDADIQRIANALKASLPPAVAPISLTDIATAVAKATLDAESARLAA